MKSGIATFYAIGKGSGIGKSPRPNQDAGVVEHITVGTPTVSYGIRLENNDRAWTELSTPAALPIAGKIHDHRNKSFSGDVVAG